jgi:formyltetrahydrofolate deformylase
MRVAFRIDATQEAECRAMMALVAADFGMRFTLRSTADRKKVLLLVSKFDHCLGDLCTATGSANCRWMWSASSATIRARR